MTSENISRSKMAEFKYEPFFNQLCFHLGRYEYFARLVSCGSGAGKTIAGAWEALEWAYDNPGSVGYLFEPTFKMVKRVLIPTLQDDLLLGSPLESHNFVKNYNRTDSMIEFTNGSKWWMIGMDDPESAEGPNVDYIWSDETRLIHRNRIDTAFKVWKRRLRGSVPGKYPVGFWCTTTPNEPGSEIWKQFEDPENKIQNSNVYRWSMDDNPYLEEQYKAEMKASHTGGLYDRFILGLFAAVGAGSFGFDSSKHVFKKPPVIRQVIYGVDFGWTNPSVIVAVGFDGDGRAYVLEEFHQRRIHSETLIEEAKQMVQRWGSGIFYCDSSEPRTIEEMRLAGLEAVPNKSKREEGIREIGGRLKKKPDGRYRLQISENCVNLIFEMQVYLESKKENDHAVDALRYALASTIRGPARFFVESF